MTELEKHLLYTATFLAIALLLVLAGVLLTIFGA